MGTVLRVASSYVEHLCVGARSSPENVATAVAPPLVSDYAVPKCESCGYEYMSPISAVCPQCGARVDDADLM